MQPPDYAASLQALLPRLTEIRHDIHKHPELGFEEERTQKLVREFLEEHGYAPRDSAGTGLIADLRPGQEGPTVALRADLDCLPIQEDLEVPYRSIHPGRSHKCGHDGHTSILLGTAALLSRLKEQVPGNVRLLFQPAEEGVRGGGAKVMVWEGALKGVTEVYGLHNWPGYTKGDVRIVGGPTMAQVHIFEVELEGVGGHGSQPQLCRDVIVAASQMVVSLQTVVSRGLGYEGGAVVSVCNLHAGNTHNVIPERAKLGGTIRSFDPKVTERVLERLEEVVAGIGDTYGVRTELEVRTSYPVLINDAACAAEVAAVAADVVGADRVSTDGLPMAGGEDFAYMVAEVPGAYFFLGAGDPAGETPVCHHPDFDFDDDLIPIGIRMFMGLVWRRLAALGAG